MQPLTNRQQKILLVGAFAGMMVARLTPKQKKLYTLSGVILTSGSACYAARRRYSCRELMESSNWSSDPAVDDWCHHEPLLAGIRPHTNLNDPSRKRWDLRFFQFDHSSRVLTALWRLPDREGMADWLRDQVDRLGPACEAGEGYKAFPELRPWSKFLRSTPLTGTEWALRNSPDPQGQAIAHFTSWLRDNDASTPLWVTNAKWLLNQSGIDPETISLIAQRSTNPAALLAACHDPEAFASALETHRRPEALSPFQLYGYVRQLWLTKSSAPQLPALIQQVRDILSPPHNLEVEDLVASFVAGLEFDNTILFSKQPLFQLALVSRRWRDATRPHRIIAGFRWTYYQGHSFSKLVAPILAIDDPHFREMLRTERMSSDHLDSLKQERASLVSRDPHREWGRETRIHVPRILSDYFQRRGRMAQLPDMDDEERLDVACGCLELDNQPDEFYRQAIKIFFDHPTISLDSLKALQPHTHRLSQLEREQLLEKALISDQARNFDRLLVNAAQGHRLSQLERKQISGKALIRERDGEFDRLLAEVAQGHPNGVSQAVWEQFQRSATEQQ